MIRLFAVVLFALLVSNCSDHGKSEAEFPSRTVDVNGIKYRYRIYSPPKRVPNEKIPVILYLHGSGARGDDNQSQLGIWPEYLAENPGRFSFVIVFPQCRSGALWSGEMNRQALAALDATVNEIDGDESRLYLVGYSMGGNGTWQNGLIHSGKFAALVPIAGYVASQTALPEEVLATLPPKLRLAAVSPDPYKVFAEGIGSTAVWVFHGSEDDAVPVAESRRVFDALKASGNQNVRYTEYEGVGHGLLSRVFREPGLFEWLGQQRLESK
ncbi:MAG: prolyl oligopeptidase family serine peptidase [Pyrinomonadaceae bacterium]